MGSFSFRIPVSGDPSDVFKEIPDRARKFLREGFDVLARIFTQYSDFLLKLPVETFVPEKEPDLNEFARSLQVSVSAARNLMGSMNFLALTATPPAPMASLPKMVAGMVDAGLLDTAAKQPVETVLAHFLNQRAAIDAAYRRVAVGSRLLPSLEDFEFDVDVRVDFEKEKVALAVPIVLVHVDTDAPHEELWFQMTKAQAAELLKDLKRVVDRLAEVEKWLPRTGT